MPHLDFSSVPRYIASTRPLRGRLRIPRAIDLFVFSRSFPFEKMHEVVVGRWWVDNDIMVFCHLSHKIVVDLSNLKSYHQGAIDSESKKSVIKTPNFSYNYRFLASTKLNAISLSSMYYTVYCVCWNSVAVVWCSCCWNGSISGFGTSSIQKTVNINSTHCILQLFYPYWLLQFRLWSVGFEYQSVCLFQEYLLKDEWSIFKSVSDFQ